MNKYKNFIIPLHILGQLLTLSNHRRCCSCWASGREVLHQSQPERSELPEIETNSHRLNSLTIPAQLWSSELNLIVASSRDRLGMCTSVVLCLYLHSVVCIWYSVMVEGSAAEVREDQFCEAVMLGFQEVCVCLHVCMCVRVCVYLCLFPNPSGQTYC